MNQVAKERARALQRTVEFWFRRKYGLTVNDPMFLAATVEDMLTDYWAHTFVDDPQAMQTIEDDDFDIDSVADELGYSDWEDLE